MLLLVGLGNPNPNNLNFELIASITKNPTLCRLFVWLGLGFPKPTKSSIIYSLSYIIFF